MKLNFRFTLFAATFILGVALSLPSFFKDMSGNKITLGLDLQGGLHMLLGIKAKKATESKIRATASSLKYFCEDEDILIDDLSVDENVFSFVLLDLEGKAKIDEMLDEIKGLDVKTQTSEDEARYSISLTPEQIKETEKNALLQAIDTIKNRLDQFGLAEPTVAKQGEDKILVELPGIKTAQEEKRARELISKPANLELMAVDEENFPDVYAMSDEMAASYGDVILLDQNDKTKKYLLKSIPIFDGSKLTDAKVGFDQNNMPVINFTLNSEGGKIFGDFTSKNIGKRLAVVLDKKVYSAPVIRERIGGGSGQISGGFSIQEAHDVAIALRSGSLLAPVVLLEKRSIGPSLGKDNINASLFALVSGFILVIAFMVFYYKLSGFISNLALISNLFIILAVMAAFGATLTLPGMAGIVLTVGMAVDANVIINERIREFLRTGVSVKKAVEQGYENAMSAILDANITTLIAAIILYAYGTGPIKGFAVTISIGILASMLTAIVGTHGIYDLLMPKLTKSKSTKKWFGI
jgi:preprotein translocase subunit SecD